MPEYSLILLILFAIAKALQYVFKIRIYRSLAHLIITNAALLLITLVWDSFAIMRGHWSFGEQFLLGPKIGVMPIEEFGFTLIGSYLILVLYKIFEKKFK